MIPYFSELVVARRNLTGTDYVHHLGRLGVDVETGARLILGDMPGNRLHNGILLGGMRCAPTDPLNEGLVEIAQGMAKDFGGGAIAPHLVPLACYELVRCLWPRAEYPDVVIFHEPKWVEGNPSVLHLRMKAGGGMALGHTHANGTWHLPQTLFAWSLPREGRRADKPF